MAIELQAVTFRSENPQRAAEFWGLVLGRPVKSDGDGLLLAGGSGQLGLRFSSGARHGTEKNRLHLHLTDGDRNQKDTIAACVASGGRLLGNGHVPENSHAILADVVGDEFCVIEDGNSYLAGCGPLGEVTCDGSRAVGVFWSQVLGWPLVWDQNEETAIQSPTGGTKIAWSGDPVNPNTNRDQQYFVVTVTSEELEDELSRLIDLGASRVMKNQASDITLRDPDGDEFVVRVSKKH